MADLEVNAPITPASVFPAASISKQFTAMSIMLLAERGLLSLDEDVRTYLPELPDYGSPLTIRHLLDHTSGLRDVFLLLELSGAEEYGGDMNERLLHLLARQRSLNYQPGTESSYNNGGYVLLAIIVRRVSVAPLGDFAQAHIFGPLGMTSTRFQADPATAMPNRVSNYSRAAGDWRVVALESQPSAVGNSGLWTTTRDLLRWASNLEDIEVGSESLLAEMQKPSRVPGAAETWGLGFEIGEHNGATFVGHGGGDRGIDNYFAWYPQQRLAVAVLCNRDGVGSRQLTQPVANLFMPPPSVEPGTARARQPTVELSLEQLEGMAGLYRETGGDTFVRAFVRDRELRAALGTGFGDSFGLVPVSDTRFAIPGTPFTFEFTPSVSGPSTELRSFAGQTQTGSFERVKPFRPSTAQLRAYAGVYASVEVNVEWTLAEHESTLVIRRRARPDTVVQPIDTDMFTTIGDFMRFSRDSRGAITGFTLVSTGVRSLTFARVNK